MTTDTAEPSALAAPSPAKRVTLRTIMTAFLGVVPALAIAGTAFLYFAGYSYLDSLRNGFGIGFAATETSTAEVMGLGYLVVLVALIHAIQVYIWHAAGEFVLTILVTFVIIVGARRGWRGFRWIENTVDIGFGGPGPHYVLSTCVIGIALMGASPAGDFAARQQKQFILDRIRADCCYDYIPKDGPAIRGIALAEDHNRLWVVNRNGVTAIPTDGLRIALRTEFAKLMQDMSVEQRPRR